MKLNSTSSNLSKIKTKFRTSGAISQPRRKAGSSLQTIGDTKGGVGNLATQEDYLNRLYYAFDNTGDEKLKRFIYGQIRQILVQQNKW